MFANNNLLQISQNQNTAIPGYEIFKKLGQGSTGTVYLGRQINMDRMVAIKVIHQQVSLVKKYKERFLQEAIFVARMNHNNIIKGFNIGEYKEAREHYQESLSLNREIGNRLGEANCYTRLGDFHRVVGEYERAREQYEQALIIFREVGERLEEAHAQEGTREATRDDSLYVAAHD